jgi:hypothetical protein
VVRRPQPGPARETGAGGSGRSARALKGESGGRAVDQRPEAVLEGLLAERTAALAKRHEQGRLHAPGEVARIIENLADRVMR